MKVFINTFQTDISYLHQMNDSEDYTMSDEEIEATKETFPVCLSLEDENGNIIASSGCYPEFPTLTKQFVRDWFEMDFMGIEITEMGNEILWVTDSGNILITEDNQLSSPPSEIYLETDQPLITSETEAHLIEVEQYFQQMLVEEGLKEQYLDFINSEAEQFSQEIDKLMDAQVSDWQEMEDLSNESEFTQNILIAQREKTTKRIELERYYDLVQLEKEGRQNLRKHKLVKRKDLQPKVDFSLLPNASGIIWTALTLLKDGAIDINHEIYQHAVKTANNLDLFMQCMKNPKFATLSSFELEKLLSK